MEQLLRELDSFLEAEAPRFRERWSGRTDTWEARCDWQRTMAAGRWAAPAWSQEHGGRGAGVAEVLAIEEATAERGLPVLPGMLGLKNVGPTLAVWGTAEQKK